MPTVSLIGTLGSRPSNMASNTCMPDSPATCSGRATPLGAMRLRTSAARACHWASTAVVSMGS